MPASEFLLGGGVAGAWLATLVRSIRGALTFFLVPLLLRVLLRRGWLAVAFVLVFSAPSLLASRHPAVAAPAMLAVYSITALALVRFGLVTLAGGILTVNRLLAAPMTASPLVRGGSTVVAFLSLLAPGRLGVPHVPRRAAPLERGALFEQSPGRGARAGAHLDILGERPHLSPRMSTRGDRVELLQGTLDLLVLRTLRHGPAHGHAIAKAIERGSADVLQVEQGSLYPALHRLIKRGWIAFDEGTSENNRRAKFYRLTATGRKQLEVETGRWDRLARAIARILRPAAQE